MQRMQKGINFSKNFEESDESNSALEMETMDKSNKENKVNKIYETSTLRKPFSKTKQYFSMKLPVRHSVLAKEKTKCSSDDSEILKDSDTSSSSLNNPSKPNESRQYLSEKSGKVSSKLQQALTPSSVTVESTQPSRLVVRNVPTSQFNIKNYSKVNNSINEVDEYMPEDSTKANSHGSLKQKILFNYDVTKLMPSRPNSVNHHEAVPCSPTVIQQNSKNSTTELSNCERLLRPQSAQGFKPSFDPLFVDKNDLASVARHFTPTPEFKNYYYSQDDNWINDSKSKSADNLLANVPTPIPRNVNFKFKPPYENIPNAIQYWENKLNYHETSVKTAHTNTLITNSQIPQSTEDTIVVSDTPLHQQNLTVLQEVFIFK